jgi:alanine racemase
LDFDAPALPEEARLRPTYAVVSRGRLRANLAAVKALAAPARVMAVLKANAYGHGLEAVAHCLAPQADAFGVALVEEGIALRRLGISNPVLVMGGIWTRQIPLFLEHGLTFTVPSIARLRDIEQAAAAHGAKATVHLKVDTGMERIGVHHYSAEGLLEAAARSPHVEVEGIYTHFANADAEDLAHARLQLERFLEVLRFYERRSLPVPVRHVANSAAILRMPEARLDMVRPGILLYGVYPYPGAPRAAEVKPALSWRSRVVYFKVVEAGSPVSYGSTWKSDHRVRLVTVPVGYGDGYFRSLSNRAEVVLREKRHPVVGRVCMDQVMVNIEWSEAWNGDEVVLIGEQGDARVTVEELALWAGTIPYEVLTAINTRVPRIYEG